MDILLQNFKLIIFIVLLVSGYLAGSWAERRHFRSINRREKELAKIIVINAEGSFSSGQVLESTMVMGSVVISIDYFKRLLAIIQNIFGGRVKAYESLVERARREAILRMKEEASKQEAKMVINLRLETATIGRNANSKKTVGCIEAIAYGTAIVTI